MNPRESAKRLTFAALLIAVAWAAGLYYLRHAVESKQGVEWDQAHHLEWGHIVYSDIVNGRWLSFLFDSYRQVYWPFLHSWFLAAFFLVFGPGIEAARLASLACFVLAGLALAYLSWNAKGGSAFAAVTAAGLWWTSGAFAVEFGTDAYVESLAICLTLASAAVLQAGLLDQSRRKLVAAGCLALLTFFAKTDYGLILIAASLSGLLWPAATARRRVLPYLAPILAGWLVWFAYPPKIAATYRALTNREQGPQPWSAEGILYHFRQLMRWSDQELVFWLALLCLLLAIRWRRDPFWRCILAYCGISIILHTISHTKDQKHIVKLLPWMFLCVATAGSALQGWLSRKLGTRPAWGAVGGIALALAWLRWEGVAAAVGAYRPTGLASLAESVAARAAPQRAILVAGGFAELSPYAVRCAAAARWPGAIIAPDEQKEAFLARANRFRSIPGFNLIERPAPAEQSIRISFAPVMAEQSSDSSRAMLQDLLERERPDLVVTFVLDPHSRWRTDDYRTFVYPGEALAAVLDEMPAYVRCAETRSDALEGFIVGHRRRDSDASSCPPLLRDDQDVVD